MFFLQSFMLSPFGWTIMSFFVLQLIAFGKGYISLLGRVKILENDLNDNTRRDTEKDDNFTKELEKLKKSCPAIATEIKADLTERLKEVKEDGNKRKDMLFKRLAEVEKKSDEADKKVWERVDSIAQGLVKAETKLTSQEKRLDRIEK